MHWAHPINAPWWTRMHRHQADAGPTFPVPLRLLGVNTFGSLFRSQSDSQDCSSPLDKMAAISQKIFSDAFSWIKSFVFLSNFTKFCSWESNWQYPGVGLDEGLAPNRRQGIIWTNSDPIHWRICATLGGEELNPYPLHIWEIKIMLFWNGRGSLYATKWVLNSDSLVYGKPKMTGSFRWSCHRQLPVRKHNVLGRIAIIKT